MKVPNVRRNLVPNAWTANRKGTLQGLSVCSHDNCCPGRGLTELSSTGFCRVDLYDVTEMRWSDMVYMEI